MPQSEHTPEPCREAMEAAVQLYNEARIVQGSEDTALQVVHKTAEIIQGAFRDHINALRGLNPPAIQAAIEALEKVIKKLAFTGETRNSLETKKLIQSAAVALAAVKEVQDGMSS